MTDYHNNAIVDVDAMHVDDRPMSIKIRQSGIDRDELGERARYAYVVFVDGAPIITGDDLHGPVGYWPEAEEMAYTLGGFLGAAYECGQLTEHGKSYSASERDYLAEHGERLASWAALRNEDKQK